MLGVWQNFATNLYINSLHDKNSKAFHNFVYSGAQLQSITTESVVKYIGI